MYDGSDIKNNSSAHEWLQPSVCWTLSEMTAHRT